MDKKERQLISEIAHEAFMIGRIYNESREQDTPSEIYQKVDEMIDRKIKAQNKQKKKYHKWISGTCQKCGLEIWNREYGMECKK